MKKSINQIKEEVILDREISSSVNKEAIDIMAKKIGVDSRDLPGEMSNEHWRDFRETFDNQMYKKVSEVIEKTCSSENYWREWES